MPVNALRRALREGRAQIGCGARWVLRSPRRSWPASGFDWVLLDTEHAPNDVTDVHRLLQAMQGSAASVVVRPPWNDAVQFKQLLDIGVQSFVVPFVQNANEARTAVAATRYPPAGIRGVATTTRANGYGRVKEYLSHANDEICVIVQIETRRAAGEHRDHRRS